jgi:hypothetical protein
MPRRFTLFTALVAIAFPALAAWEPLASTKLGDKTVDVFFDAARIRDQDGYRMVWQLDNIRDEVPADHARSAVRLFAVDCARASTALADLVLYKEAMGKGPSLGRQPAAKLEFEAALPDSVAEQLVFRACVPPEQQRLLRDEARRGDAVSANPPDAGGRSAVPVPAPPTSSPDGRR